jgi:hypothetical protein
MNYRSQGDRGCRQSYETTIPGVWLVDCIGIIVAELLDDLADFVVFLVRTCVSHEPLKPVGFVSRESVAKQNSLTQGHPVSFCRKACRSAGAELLDPC